MQTQMISTHRFLRPLSSLSTSLPATLRRRILAAQSNDAGMSTVEYALGTVAAAAFGALLYTVVTGGQISEALSAIIERALNTQ